MCIVTIEPLKTDYAARSLPRDAYRIEDISSSPISAEDRWQPSRRTSHQEHPEVLFTPDRAPEHPNHSRGGSFPSCTPTSLMIVPYHSLTLSLYIGVWRSASYDYR